MNSEPQGPEGFLRADCPSRRIRSGRSSRAQSRMARSSSPETGRPLPDGAVGSEDRHPGRAELQDLAGPEAELPHGPGLADVQDTPAALLDGANQSLLLREELVQAVHQRHAGPRALHEARGQVRREDPPARGHTHDAVGRPFAGKAEHLGNGLVDWNPSVASVQNLARVATGTFRIDDAQDPEAAGAPHDAVGGLGKAGSEETVGQDDGGLGHGVTSHRTLHHRRIGLSEPLFHRSSRPTYRLSIGPIPGSARQSPASRRRGSSP
jgi:hypothetical protein